MKNTSAKIIMTGGHHSSALPVIRQLKQTLPQIEIYWMGHKHSLLNDKNTTLEYREITALNIPFYHLHAGKVYKTLNIGRLLKVPVGFVQAFFLLLKIRPGLIVSFGGYLAVPVVIAGWLLRIPSITHEQTVVSGYANRLISLFAEKILVSWESSVKHFPAEKVVLTGIPLRSGVLASTSNSFDLNSALPTIYITAGKTGSHKINTAVNGILEKLLDFANVIHQCGDYSQLNDFQMLESTYKKISKSAPGKYHLKKFIMEDAIGEAFSKSDLVISRSGAHITAELLYLEKPCILIPIPWVSHNEQNKNAQVLEKAGLAVILAEDNLTLPLLEETIKSTLKNLSNFKLTDPLLKKSINPDAALCISNEIRKILNES